MTSFELKGLSNHQQLDCFFNDSFRLTTKQTSKLPYRWLCVRGIYPEMASGPITKDQLCWKHFLVMTSSWVNSLRPSDAYICVSKLRIIGSYYGLSPGWCQAIIWTSDGILLNWPLGTNSSEMLIEIHIFSFKKMHVKLAFGKLWPFCLGLHVLRRMKLWLHSWTFSSETKVSDCQSWVCDGVLWLLGLCSLAGVKAQWSKALAFIIGDSFILR